MFKLCIVAAIVFLGQKAQGKFLEPISDDEKILIQDLREKMMEKQSGQSQEDFDHMQRWLDENHDRILLNYVRYGEHDMDKIIKSLKKSVDWRRENDIENIFEWKYPSDFPKRFPFKYTGINDQNMPVLQMIMGEWDFREAAAKGQRNDLLKWLTLMLEIGKKMAQEHEDPETGLPQGNFNFIVDLDGFKLSQVTSIRALSTAVACASIFESVFPLYPANTFIIRAPSYFTIMWEAVKRVLSPTSLKRMTVTDADVKNWKPPLSLVIPPRALSTELGGTSKVRPFNN